jgi:alcohol dehydrogenase (cytochrome c)
MRTKRKLLAAMMSGLALAVSVTLLGGALTASVASAKSATTAKSKHKKPKKKTCKAGEELKGGKCVKKPTPPAPEPTQAEKEKKQIEEVAKGGTKAIESASEIPVAPEFTPAQLNAESDGNWLSSQGGGTTGDHMSLLSEITPANVASLKADWMTQLDGSGEASKYSGEADVVAYDGVGYYPTGADDIFAISLKSGKILWLHKGELPETIADVCCGWDNRGVSIGGGMVFSSVLTGSVEALNQQTGALIWKTEMGEPAEGFTATTQPLYYDGKVFAGPVGSEYGVRGFMEAFNAKTGALLWKHYNIPAPGEFGHETWPVQNPNAPGGITGTCKECDQEWQHGGATTWNAPTVDPKTNTVEYSTANAGGIGVNGGDSGGDTRGGEDLWTASMLSLNANTGELVWGYQEVHHDIWDYDQSVAPVMTTATIEGKTVEGIVAGNKDGFLYYVNAETGVPIFPAPETPVPQDVALEATFPTQPIPSIPPPENLRITPEELALAQAKACEEAAKTTAAHKPFPCPKVVNGGWNEDDVFAPFTEVGSSTVELSSGGGSGMRIENNAYDPENDELYTCSRGPSASGKQLESQVQLPQGETFGVGKSGLSASITLPTGTHHHGFIAATNLATGKQTWMIETPEECYAGPTVTKGGVIFEGERESTIVAYEASTGKKLWTFEVGAPTSMVSVYEQENEERVSIYAAGNNLEGGATHADDLWQFSLKGSGAQGPIAEGQTPKEPTTTCTATLIEKCTIGAGGA